MLSIDRQFWKPYEHVTYNGWANGWIIDAPESQSDRVTEQNPQQPNNIPVPKKAGTTQQHVVILYWPQLLEFLGLGVLILTGLIISGKFIFKKKRLHSALN